MRVTEKGSKAECWAWKCHRVPSGVLSIRQPGGEWLGVLLCAACGQRATDGEAVTVG